MSYSRKRINYRKEKARREAWEFVCNTIALLSLVVVVYAFGIVAYAFN
jgi:hypothetical protein